MTDKQFYIAAGLGVVAVVYFVRKAGQGVAAVGNAINPTNNDNIFYGAVNAIGDTFDDGDNNDSFSLGSWLYELTHSDEI